MNIQESINFFMNGIENNDKYNGRKPLERYSSFDYCYNYFQSFIQENRIEDIASIKNIQESCLQIGFYLASWGMLRGSSTLLWKSVKYYEKLIKTISKLDKSIWFIDVDNYTDENINQLIEVYNKIEKSFENGATDTLITKIMLGVFGNIPAFDSYFKKTMKVSSVNKSSLKKINSFYNQHKKEIDNIHINTIDYHSEKETKYLYKKAKIIDMIGFGYSLNGKILSKNSELKTNKLQKNTNGEIREKVNFRYNNTNYEVQRLQNDTIILIDLDDQNQIQARPLISEYIKNTLKEEELLYSKSGKERNTRTVGRLLIEELSNK